MASYSRPSPPLELDSTLSPLDALASHTRKLTIKRTDLHHPLSFSPSPPPPPPPRADSSAYSASAGPGSPAPSSSSYPHQQQHRPALHALLIPNKPNPHSPLLSPQFSDVPHPPINRAFLRPLQHDDHQRDSVATFATDTTDYVWDQHDDDQDDCPIIPANFSRPSLARQPSTGQVTRSRARTEVPREQFNSVYAHQELAENPLPTDSNLNAHLDEPEPLEVLDPTRDPRHTWASATSAQSDSESEAGWESNRYQSGHSISSEDPFQYSHYETPRDPQKPFATFPTRLPPSVPPPHITSTTSRPPVSHVRNFSRPLRPPSAKAPDLPTPPPSRDMSPREVEGRQRASTTASRSSVDTASSGATRRSLKSLFNRLRHDSGPTATDPSPISPSNEPYHPPAITFNYPQQPHIHFASEPVNAQKEKERASHRLSIYSLPPTDAGPSTDKQRYASRSPISLNHPDTPTSRMSDLEEVLQPVREPAQAPTSYRRQSQLPAAMAKAKASLGNRPSTSAGRTAHDYLQLGIEAHERGEMERSAGLFERSAREGGGCGTGMLMWGLAQRHGWGCQVNEVRAFKWLQKAAESVVEDVENVAKGKEEACAMKNELVLAIYELGMCFMRGWGCKKDKALAISYFELAAKLGDPDAQQELGFCYANGKGAKKDLKKAAKFYRMASKQGIEMMGAQWIWKSKYD